MKKIFIFVLLFFLVPQITFASWWNPISWFNRWKFSNTTETTENIRTQVLENRVKELENKLEKTTAITSQKAEPVVTNKTLAPPPPKPKPTTVPITIQPKEENKVQTAITNYNDHIAYIEKDIAALKIVSDHANKAILELPGDKSSYQRLAELGHADYLVSVVNSRFSGYESDLRKDKKAIDSYTEQLRAYQEDTRSEIAKTENLYIDINDLIRFLDSIGKRQDEIDVAVKLLGDSHFDLYDKIADDKEQLRKAIDDQATTYFNSRATYRPANCVLTQVSSLGPTDTWLSSCY